jgi:lysozyme
MTVKAILRDHIMQSEGIRLKPYMDTAIPPRLTIGYGRNLTDRGISAQEAGVLLDNDIEHVVRQCETAFAWFPALDPIRQACVAELVFNNGLEGFIGFHHTIAALACGDYDTAADQLQDSHWFRQVKSRGPRLVNMLRTGLA